MDLTDIFDPVIGGDADALDDAEQIELDVDPPEGVDRDLTYETGQWVRYLWDELMREDPDAAVRIKTRYPNTEWPGFVREVFGRLYGTTKKLPEVPLGAEWAEPLHDILEQLPEWRELEVECRGDDSLSAVAATQLQDEVELPDPPPASPTESAQTAAECAEADPKRAEHASAQTVERIEASQQQAQEAAQPAKASAVRRRLRTALRGSLEAARATKGALSMFSCGSEPSAAQRRAWVQRIHEHKQLARIAELAGRMETKVQEAEAAEVISEMGREDLVGLKLGSSLAESVPMERALFTHPVLGLLQAAKMSEGRLLQNRQVGLVDENKAGGGPLVFACDESGSMGGYGDTLTKNVIAKAVALTIARKCAQNKRTFAYLHWSMDTVENVYPKGASLNSTIAEELALFLNGGTDLPRAITTAASIVRGEQPEMPREDAQRADVVLITDACHYEHGETAKALDELALTGARLFVVHVDDGPEHPLLKERAVSYLKVTGETLNEGMEIALTVHANTKERA